jgi:hypothetical protein
VFYSETSAGNGVTTRERYRQLAAECLCLAKQSQNPEHAARLVQMAEAWRELAERVARTGGGKTADNEKE